MEENIIMTNEETVGVVEEIATSTSMGKGFKVVGVLGIVAAVGAVAYWGYNKIKAKKQAEVTDFEDDDWGDDFEEQNDESEDTTE